MGINACYICAQETREGAQFLVSEPLGMQILITDLLRGETRVMYNFLGARKSLSCRPPGCRHAGGLDILMRDLSTFHAALDDAQKLVPSDLHKICPANTVKLPMKNITKQPQLT